MTKLLKDAIFEQIDDCLCGQQTLLRNLLNRLYSEIESYKNATSNDRKFGFGYNVCADELLNLEVKEPYEAPTVEPIIKASHEVKNENI